MRIAAGTAVPPHVSYGVWSARCLEMEVRNASKLLPTNLSAVDMRKVRCSAMVEVTNLGEETLFKIKVSSHAARALRTLSRNCALRHETQRQG